MMKINDFQKYEVTLKISYEDYFTLIYDSKYLLEARLGSDRNFIAKKPIYGNSRKKAVKKAVQWFWKDFKGALGSAHKVMTVNDPHEEVVYSDDFACNDLSNKYLDEKTIARVIEQADGDLARDESEGSENHPPNSLKRIKRRRKVNKEIAHRLFQSPSGFLFYKTTETSGVKGGRAKTRMVKLSSKDLGKALKEVSRRGLNKYEIAETPKKKCLGSSSRLVKQDA